MGSPLGCRLSVAYPPFGDDPTWDVANRLPQAFFEVFRRTSPEPKNFRV